MKSLPTRNNSPSQQRILIGLREIAGIGSSLKAGLDEIGCKSDFLNLGGSLFAYRGEKNSAPVEFINRHMSSLGSRFSKTFIMRVIWLLLFQPVIGLVIFPWFAFRYDSFVFLSNSSFFYFLDTLILRILGKKVVYVFLGTDSRPAYMNGYVTGANPGLAKLSWIVMVARMQKAVIRLIDRLSSEVIDSAPQGIFHGRKFVNLLKLGLPTEVKQKRIKRDSGFPRIRILHAPSKTGPKGSAQIVEIVSCLKAQGLPVDLVMVTGRPNSEVLDEIEKADLIIDEVYSDTPMSRLATEGAARGVPTLVGGYYAEQTHHDLQPEEIPPSFFVKPEEIETTLLELVTHPEALEEMGARAYDFVSLNWKRDIVAKKILDVLNGKIGASYFVEPKQLRYFRGCGLSAESLDKIIFQILKRLGKKFLWLSDRPEMEKQILTRSAHNSTR